MVFTLPGMMVRCTCLLYTSILKFGLLVAQRTSPVAEGNAAVHAAVSYTHLDVYKRQEAGCGRGLPGEGNECGAEPGNRYPPIV